MKDKEFLIWLHQRLKKVHSENPYYDYMHKLRAIIEATPEDQMTPNVSGQDIYDDYPTQVETIYDNMDKIGIK